MNKAEIKKYAAFRAALILESVVQAGWWPEELEREHGAAVVGAVAEEISAIAAQLLKRSGRTPS